MRHIQTKATYEDGGIAEPIFMYPEYFEWLQLNPERTKVVHYNAENQVKKAIKAFLKDHGNAAGKTLTEEDIQNLYKPETSEAMREAVLFGPPLASKSDHHQRNLWRTQLEKYLRAQLLEPAPVVYDAPYRPLKIDTKQDNTLITHWKVEGMPQVRDGNPVHPGAIVPALAPFKLYHLTQDGKPNLKRPNKAAWEYVTKKALDLQKTFGFDFFRADVGHAQLDAFGRSKNAPTAANFWRHLKESIQKQAPYFASYGEEYYGGSFVDPRKNADKKGFDVVMGWLHSTEGNKQNADGSVEILLEKIRNLYKHPKTQIHRPAFTFGTSDQDQPTSFTPMQNPKNRLVKAFAGYFLNTPSLFSMGLETRENKIDITKPDFWQQLTHPYQFRVTAPYQWGRNTDFFSPFTRIRRFWAEHKTQIAENTPQWRHVTVNKAPDSFVGAWLNMGSKPTESPLLFVLNSDLEHAKNNITITLPTPITEASEAMRTNGPTRRTAEITVNGKKLTIANMPRGTGRVYRLKLAPST